MLSCGPPRPIASPQRMADLLHNNTASADKRTWAVAAA
jgi:hypothetical protein